MTPPKLAATVKGAVFHETGGGHFPH